MRVGLEATVLLAHRFTGVQRYITELSRALFALQAPDTTFSLLLRLGDYRKRRLLPPNPWPTRWYCSGPWPALPKCDVIHGLDVHVPGAWNTAACVATVHDLSPFTLPNYGSKRSLRNTQERYRRAARCAKRIVAISRSTKADFARVLDFPDERIDVVYHGVSPMFLEAPQPPAGEGARGAPPYFMAFAGTPRKNLPRLIRAFAASKRRAMHLRIVGPPDTEISRAIERTHVSPRVTFEPHLSEADLRRLYLESSGLLYPSLREGFGLPILEAMASRVPVLTSRGSSTEEVAGGHAVLVDPLSIDDISAGIDRLADVTLEALEPAAKHAATFTWKRAALQTLDVYRHLA